MALMASVLLVPLLLLSAGLLYQGHQDIQAARRAQSSLGIMGQLNQAMQSLQRGRALTLQTQAGDTGLARERDTVRQELKSRAGTTGHPTGPTRRQSSPALAQALQRALPGSGQRALPESPAATNHLYGDLIEGTGHMLQASAEDAGLLNDPETITHFLIDLLVEHLPAWSEDLAQTRLSAADVAREQRAQVEHNAILKLNLAATRTSCMPCKIASMPLLEQGRTPTTWESTRKASDAFTTLSHQLLAAVTPIAPPTSWLQATMHWVP